MRRGRMWSWLPRIGHDHSRTDLSGRLECDNGLLREKGDCVSLEIAGSKMCYDAGAYADQKIPRSRSARQAPQYRQRIEVHYPPGWLHSRSYEGLKAKCSCRLFWSQLQPPCKSLQDSALLVTICFMVLVTWLGPLTTGGSKQVNKRKKIVRRGISSVISISHEKQEKENKIVEDCVTIAKP